jgi:hypothetical protein
MASPVEQEISIMVDGVGVDTDPDPWKHRSKGMKCSTCMWFALKVPGDPGDYATPRLGRCRRHAPTMNGFPAVFVDDWCGDHKLDENKL